MINRIRFIIYDLFYIAGAVFKLTGVITWAWSWAWVFSPLKAGILFLIILLISGVIIREVKKT